MLKKGEIKTIRLLHKLCFSSTLSNGSFDLWLYCLFYVDPLDFPLSTIMSTGKEGLHRKEEAMSNLNPTSRRLTQVDSARKVSGLASSSKPSKEPAMKIIVCLVIILGALSACSDGSGSGGGGGGGGDNGPVQSACLTTPQADLTFSRSDTQPQTVELQNRCSATGWSASANADVAEPDGTAAGSPLSWLIIYPNSGNLDRSGYTNISISLNTSYLPSTAGVYTGTISFYLQPEGLDNYDMKLTLNNF